VRPDHRAESSNRWSEETGQVIGDLSGNGSSVAVSATGSIAAVSYSLVNSGGPAANSLAGITQSSTNDNGNTVTNTGGTIMAGALSGVDSSASIGATGAASSVSIASVNYSVPSLNSINGTVSQTTANNLGANVTNTGKITLSGPISGNGASASVSATGALSSVAFRSVK